MSRGEVRRLRVSSVACLWICLLVLVAGCSSTSTTVSRTAPNFQRFVAAADDFAEYEIIWGRTPTQGQQSRQSAVLDDAISQGLTALRSTSTETAAQRFTSLYRSSSADVVTLVGHNEGGIFRFPDGSTADLRSVGSEGGPILAMISCDSAEYSTGQKIGLPTAVTIELAVDVEQRFVAKISALDALPTTQEVGAILEEALREATSTRPEAYKFYLIGGVTGTAVVGVGIYQVVP